MGIPSIGARNPHCPEYPLYREILVGIPDSGDSGPWGFRTVGIPGTYQGRSQDFGRGGALGRAERGRLTYWQFFLQRAAENLEISVLIS